MRGIRETPQCIVGEFPILAIAVDAADNSPGARRINQVIVRSAVHAGPSHVNWHANALRQNEESHGGQIERK